MANGRNPLKGRHSVGGQTARPGGIRGGQSEPAGNKGGGITGSSTSMRPKAPILANQAETSRDIARRVMAAPQPFTNTGGGATLPAPTHPGYRSTGNPKELNYKKSHVGCANTSLSADEMAAVGYGPNDTKGDWSIISGQPTRNNQRQAGKPGKSNQNTSARENARVRQTGY